MASIQPTTAERFIRGILPENPVYRQLLGLCPTLAVTGNMKAAVTMSGAVAFVLVCANIMTSLIRPLLKPHLRILVFTLTIATFVTVADRFLAAFVYPMSQELGPYVPLIIVNCIIICRCEVCASKQGLVPAVGDALGQALGFTLALASIATVRELLGAGSWFGVPLFWQGEAARFRWGIMGQPPGAFITLGLLLATVMAVGHLRSQRKAVR
jgi:electron transport complex protein RnfE